MTLYWAGDYICTSSILSSTRKLEKYTEIGEFSCWAKKVTPSKVNKRLSIEQFFGTKSSVCLACYRHNPTHDSDDLFYGGIRWEKLGLLISLQGYWALDYLKVHCGGYGILVVCYLQCFLCLLVRSHSSAEVELYRPMRRSFKMGTIVGLILFLWGWLVAITPRHLTRTAKLECSLTWQRGSLQKAPKVEMDSWKHSSYALYRIFSFVLAVFRVVTRIVKLNKTCHV